MDVKAKKLEAGLYRVVVDGRDTSLVIAKGTPPKYRNPQFWEIGRRVGDRTDWLCGDQHGLDGALATIKAIMSASQ